MTGRLINISNLCTNPDNHRTHICELARAGQNEEIERLQQQPKYICGNCGQKAEIEGALCAPGPFHD